MNAPMSDLAFEVMIGDFPTRVRRRRLDRGLSLRKAAKEIGIPHATLDRFEQFGGAELSYSRLCKLAGWMNEPITLGSV